MVASTGLSCSEHVIVLSDIDGDKISGGQRLDESVCMCVLYCSEAS